jgi:acetyltransferase
MGGDAAGDAGRRAERAGAAPEAGDPGCAPHVIGGARHVIARTLAAGRSALSEHEAKQVLAEYGIPVTAETLVREREELGEALRGFALPVVLKVDSPDILHKTEAGLVALGCGTVDEAYAAFDRIVGRAAERFPAAAVNGVLVQEMVQDTIAECIVGMKKDPQFGPTILFGLGGIFVEVFEDVALRVAPITESDANQMVRETKGFKLLDGARGRAKADVGAVADVLVRMSRLALDLESYLAEADINPLMVGRPGALGGRSVVAADALMLLDPAGAQGAA